MEKLFSEIKTAVRSLEDELIRFRRILHQEPEPGWKEFKTTGRIIDFLEAHGQFKITQPLATGLIADMEVDSGNPFVAIRADIDALDIQDEKQVSYHSKIRGLCHACGHDVHTAIVCGIGSVLQQFRRHLGCNVRLIFQPAEEPIPSGAPEMIKNGVLNDVKTIWGMHVEPRMLYGLIGLTPGWVNAHSTKLSWRIAGKAGHSARPAQALNPILPSTMLIHQIHRLFSSAENDEKSPLVLTFTGIRSGEAYNAIPEISEIFASLRVISVEKREWAVNQMAAVNRRIEKDNGVRIEFEVTPGAPPVYNDPQVISRMRSISQRFPEFQVNIHDGYRSMGGDDFSWYLQEKPGAMIRIGIADSPEYPKLHHGLFDVPESVIGQAILFFVWQLINWSEG